MFDPETLARLVDIYIAKNFNETVESKKFHAHGLIHSGELDEVDFRKLYAQAKYGGETFSEMLMRLIKESGEKNSVIYKRAGIDRRHFSKIANHEDYQPSKQTVLAFALALKLDFMTAKELLALAGFTLSNANLADVIVSFFIEYKIFDVDLANRILHKYDQPLLGG